MAFYFFFFPFDSTLPAKHDLAGCRHRSIFSFFQPSIARRARNDRLKMTPTHLKKKKKEKKKKKTKKQKVKRKKKKKKKN